MMIRKTYLKKLSIFVLLGASVFQYGYAKQKTVVPELTLKQKETDIRYFAKLIREEYPFAEINVEIKGLHDIKSLEKIYLKKALATRNNEEFLEVFKEYLNEIQSSHGYIVNEELAKTLTSWAPRYFFSLNKKAISRADYWIAIDHQLFEKWYAYSNLDTIYGQGKNYLLSDYITQDLNEKLLPAGTVIEKINGIKTDDYVKAQSDKLHLNYDSILHKLFLHEPLVINPGNNPGWRVEFRLPDGTRYQTLIPKRSPYNPPLTYPNTYCVELAKNVGYIRIFSFEDNEFTNKDYRTIKEFMEKAKGQYKKLIIDIRENVGGNPQAWMDSIMAPLIKKPLVYQENVAIRRKMFAFGFKFFIYKLLGSKVPYNFTSPAYHCKKVEELSSWPGFDSKDWRFFRFTREIDPRKTLPFKGRIYLLTTTHNYSASEIFVSAAKKTGFATIVGIRTGGGAAALLTVPYFALPESGIIFRMDVDYVLNPDGKPNEVYYTEPDVYLNPEFPPKSLQKEVLMQDPWIKKVISYYSKN
jgi:Periplasmic protease